MEMNSCAVEGCPSFGADENSGIIYHRFPEDEQLRTVWATVVRDVSWEPSDADTVCSLHFRNADYCISPKGEPFTLLPDAIPTIENMEDKTNEESATTSKQQEQPATAPVGEKSLFARLYEQVKIDKTASRPSLMRQFSKACAERVETMKQFKVTRRKIVRTIERMKRAHDKQQKIQIEEEMGPEPEPPKKKKKKSEAVVKIHPQSLEEVVEHLEKEELLSMRALNYVRQTLGPALFEAIDISDKSGQNADRQLSTYSAVMKTFAKTLLCFSSEAYHNVKELFDIPIPSISVARTWYNMGLGLPGWSSEAFIMLKDEIEKAGDGPLHNCIIVGDFDLQSRTVLDDVVRGHVDFGTTGDLDFNVTNGLPLAKSALFFLLVPTNYEKKWRIPLAYFLVDTITPEERANLLLECLWRVYNMGSITLSVVFDTRVLSRQTAECLGIRFEDLPHPCTSFPHPADGLSTVHVIFDPSQLLDLLRHTWASMCIMVDEKGGAINWKYFTELVKVQETQAGCSESSEQNATWYWDRNLMRKKLISQLFTSNVADAMECCRSSIQLPQFQGSESTESFIRMIEKTFNLFKSKNCAFARENFHDWKKIVVEALNYLFVLRDRLGQGIFATNCRAPFVCLYMNLMTLLELSKLTSTAAMPRFSLDALELLFLAIRSHSNWKESPTVNDFTNAYISLLQEEGLALSSSRVKMDSTWWVDDFDVLCARREGLSIVKPTLKNENTPGVPLFLTFYPVLLPGELQRFRASQLVMVHTLKRVAELVHCDTCILGLQMPYVQDNPTLVLLRRTCGGFVYPSESVIRICRSAERHLKTEIRTAPQNLKSDCFNKRDAIVLQKICIAVMGDMVEGNPFPELREHCWECSPDSDHVSRLVRAVTASYVLLRLQPLRAWCPI